MPRYDPFRPPPYVMDSYGRMVSLGDAPTLVDGSLVGAPTVIGAPATAGWGQAFAFALGVSLATHVAMHFLFRSK